MDNFIYTISDDVELTPEVLAQYIGRHEQEVVTRLQELKAAYEGDYKIFHLPKKPDKKPDHRLAVGFAKYITDTFTGYFMGVPVKESSDDEHVAAFLSLFSQYDSTDDKNSELAKACSEYGRAYQMLYVDEDGEIASVVLTPIESFMIVDDSVLRRPRYFVRLYKDSKGIVRGSVSDEAVVKWFKKDPSVIFEEEAHVHGFHEVPAVEFIANSEKLGLYEGCMSLIDSFNEALSEKANDVSYFADAYLKILGAELSEKERQYLRDHRIINLSGGDAEKIVVDFLQKPDADATQEHLLERLHKLIFQTAMVADISDENFASGSSGISLKYKLLSMSNLAKAMSRKFQASFDRRYKLICSNPITQLPGDAWASIRYKWTENVPSNLLEEAQTAEKLVGVVSKRTNLEGLSIVPDVDAELSRIAEESAESYETEYETTRTETVDTDIL